MRLENSPRPVVASAAAGRGFLVRSEPVMRCAKSGGTDRSEAGRAGGRAERRERRGAVFPRRVTIDRD